MPAAERTIEAIRAAGADIVCLQETTPAWERRLRDRLDGRYPHSVFEDRGRYGCGLATLSVWPVHQVAYVPALAGGRFPSVVVRAETPIGSIQLVNVHLTPPSGANWLGLRPFLRTLRLRECEVRACWPHVSDRIPAIVLGDFNEGDWGFALDWLDRNGFSDALRGFDTGRHTWRLTRRRSIRERLDHVVYSRHLRCLWAEVLHVGGSDHYPVTAVLCRLGA